MDSSTQLPVTFDSAGLFPVVVTDHDSGRLLMLAYMDQEALSLTLETGDAHYYSRSRQALWRKGETSGHTQRVVAVRVNCEGNSLQLLVEQRGAVCHEGYATCFFRVLNADGSLEVVESRQFDPATVYPNDYSRSMHAWYGAYQFIRDSEPVPGSTTSALLHQREVDVSSRIADELEELAGVLDGTHQHSSLEIDVVLEGSQVLYWLAVEAIGNDISWAALRPDRTFHLTESIVVLHEAESQLRARATDWRIIKDTTDLIALIDETLSAVAHAASAAGVSPGSLIESDLAHLREKTYLEVYFEAID